MAISALLGIGINYDSLPLWNLRMVTWVRAYHQTQGCLINSVNLQSWVNDISKLSAVWQIRDLTAALRPGKLKKASGPCLWGI